MKKITKWFMVVALGLALSGCKTSPNFVVVTSGTTVGFDVSESPATETPQATLAYKRVELAIVPVSTNGITPDVLMDFTFKTAIFSSSGGIHSRLAVGPHATTQLPAAVMMSKDSSGSLPPITNLIPIIGNLVPINKSQ